MPNFSLLKNSISEKSAFFSFLFLSIACLFFAFFPHLTSLAGAWQSDEYSHGPLIPLVALLLGWHKLTEQKPPHSSSFWGLGGIVSGAIFLLIGHLSAFEPLAYYGLLLTLVGLSLAFMGVRATKVAATAFIYLIFCIPLPRLIYVNLSQDLQLLSSTLGAWPLKIIGIPVFQDGNVIDLGPVKLQVVEACSGLRYLFPLMSFGFLIAVLYEARFWKRALLFLSTIPITVIVNALRLTIIGLSVELWNARVSEGLVHDLEGWVLFLVCLLLLAGEVWLLDRIGRKGRFRYDYIGFANGPLFRNGPRLKAPAIAAFFLCALLAAGMNAGLLDNREEHAPYHPPLISFGLHQGAWQGAREPLSPALLADLKLDDYLLATYRKDIKTPPVNLYIAYYDQQRVGGAAHSPANCIPAGGWQVADKKETTIRLSDGTSLKVSRLIIKKDRQTQLIYFWFDERGRILTSQYEAKWFLFWDSLTMRRTDGATIRISTPLNLSEQDAETRLKDFLSVAYPQIKRFIPGQTLSAAEDLSYLYDKEPTKD